MPTIDYKPIANGVGANVESQAQYLIDLGVGGSLEDGYQAGTALSDQVNKTFRQTSMMSAALANFISNTLATNVLDDGDLPALITLLTSAFNAVSWTTGDIKLTMKVAADAGWVLCNDGTIGNATSGATTRANADCAALYTLLWTNVPQAWAPVTAGRGASAAADFAASKPMALTRMMGRALAIAGGGAGLTAAVLGEYKGAETVVLDTTMIPAHLHAFVTGNNSVDHTHLVNGNTAAVADHNHVVNDPGHVHGLNDPGHTHTFQGYQVVTGGQNTAQMANYAGPAVVETQPHIQAAGTGITENAAYTGVTLDAAGGHNHAINFNTGNQSMAHTHAGNTGNTGGGLGHANIQPTSFVNCMIKL